MANVLSPEQQEQVRALGRLGWSLRRIQSVTGVRRETVSNYLLAAGISIRRERARRLEVVNPEPNPASQVTAAPGSEANPASQVFLDAGDPPPAEVLTSAARSLCEAHRDFIAGALDLGRNGKAIWQELVDRHGFGGSYESVKRFIR